VLAVVKAAAELELPVKVTALLALAENMPSGTATRVSDVLTMKGGTTVEVINTDAEGRLVLGDALVHASELEPDAIVDVATLTGAAVVALGERIGVLMASDDDLADALLRPVERDRRAVLAPAAGHRRVRRAARGAIADLKNSGTRAAGTIFAGLFLHRFVGEGLPWAHLDIAGTGVDRGGLRLPDQGRHRCTGAHARRVVAGRLTAGGGGMTGYLLLANAAAGSADDEAIAAARDELARDHDVEVVATEGPDDLDRALDGRGARTLVVCGGDGSVHVVVDALRRRGTSSRRRSGSSRSGPATTWRGGRAAVRRSRGGGPPGPRRPGTDAGPAGRRRRAGLRQRPARRGRRRRRGPRRGAEVGLSELAYPLGALLAGVTASGVAARVEVDGAVVVEDDVLLVAVCNGPGFGGGTEVAPDADPATGARRRRGHRGRCARACGVRSGAAARHAPRP
jgi:hypothetical protein